MIHFDDEDETPESSVSFTVTVPEVFTGSCIGQVNHHRGRIEAIEHSDELMVIHGDIPANQFASLTVEIEQVTDGTGKITLREIAIPYPIASSITPAPSTHHRLRRATYAILTVHGLVFGRALVLSQLLIPS
jgi:hypothetical protein